MELEASLLSALVAAHPNDAASWLESSPAAEGAAVLSALSADAAALVVQRLPSLVAARALSELGAGEAGRILSCLEATAAPRVLRAMAPAGQQAALESLEPERRSLLQRQLAYPAASAGALMDPAVSSFLESCSVEDALERIRNRDEPVIDYLYVTDELQHLSGILHLPDLLRARASDRLGSLCRRDVVALPARAPATAVLAHPAWRWLHALPVVSETGVFLGVLSFEALRQLELPADARAVAPEAVAGAALGELYALSLRGLLEGAAALMAGLDVKPAERPR